ncbi:GNAT family N-acetyltransferase [Parashewanella spongiae]|uniref:GNAT family N-acetyltransferase n=2 Tax=Parashewanella spongiae TaxID=342950 RepID=A0A3A6TU50_9GAMM|nr:GNAT family N-acetyltransferase [Parashewanella spongiae]
MHEEDFEQVIELGNLVHGAGYLDFQSLSDIYFKGIKNDINANFVALDEQRLLGFRLTYAADKWSIDKWCSIAQWGIKPELVCYFKCNTVAENARGKGLGGLLLSKSIEAARQQGAKAGLAHLWKQSPQNSAVRYFTKAGGKLIKEHQERWSWENMSRHYNCILCAGDCRCTACEMLLNFE